jgi:hypothetical protein
MPTPRFALASASLALLLVGASCDSQPPIPPPDPEGKDLVAGAIIAAKEKTGGIRVYKMVHVDDYPPPIGHEFHMVAYNPIAPTFEEARRLHKTKGLTVVLDHILVRKVLFMPRDHRVIAQEAVTEQEQAVLRRSRRQYPKPAGTKPPP